jgi:hypothetical protein
MSAGKGYASSCTNGTVKTLLCCPRGPVWHGGCCPTHLTSLSVHKERQSSIRIDTGTYRCARGDDDDDDDIRPTTAPSAVVGLRTTQGVRMEVVWGW